MKIEYHYSNGQIHIGEDYMPFAVNDIYKARVIPSAEYGRILVEANTVNFNQVQVTVTRLPEPQHRVIFHKYP